LALAVACAGGPRPQRKQPPQPEPAPIAPAITVPGEAEIRAIAEIMLMEDRRALDPARMASLAEHWSAHVRERAALALGRVRDAGGTAALLDLLEDEDARVRTTAAFALGLIPDSSASVVHALAAVARTHPADSLGTEAVASLAKAGSAAALDSLLAIIESADPAAPSPVASEALVSLWRFGPRAGRALQVAAPFARGPDAQVRWRAIYPFVRNRIAAGARLNLELSSDPDHAVRALAIRGLRATAIDSVGVGDTARGTVRGALSDPHPHVRVNALGTIAASRMAEAAPDMRALLDDGDGNVRLATIQALAAIGGTADDFERAAGDDDEIGVRIAALGALAALDAQRAAAVAREWADADDWLDRMVAARTLASVPWQAAKETLILLAGDADARVARAAIGAVSRAGVGDAGKAVLLDALMAADPRIRAAAIDAIGRQGSAAQLAVLMDAYEAAQRDTVSDAARAAVDALGRLGSNGSPVANAFFARFGPHRDPEVRRAVASRIGDGWGEMPVEGTTRGLAFYEEVVRTLIVPVLAGEAAPLLRIETPDGSIDIELMPVEAPLTVHNIIQLVASGYYDANGDPDARRWHRVVPNFVLQDGEPNGDGSGSPGYSIRDEINRLRYDRGMLGMALSGPDTGGGQWFITHSPQPHLDGGYTIFGRVVNGMAAADAVVQEDRILGMEIVRR
jgi:cyclophilin family peptidyl-prolyl cis-trans isomerase/HEAT repeat protein